MDENTDTERTCWICFVTEGEEVEEEEGGNKKKGRTLKPIWVHACGCKGDMKWTHEKCLLSWIDEKQKGVTRKPVQCAQCRKEYVVAYPAAGVLLKTAETMTELVNTMFPYIAISGLIYCAYISSVTYGFYAIVHMLGPEQSEKLLWDSPHWGWRFYFGLPAIPITLICSRLSNLDSLIPLVPILLFPNNSLTLTFPPSPAFIVSILPWLRIAYNSLFSSFCRWLEKSVTPTTKYQLQLNGRAEDGRTIIRNPIGTVVGALLLPALSSAVGSLFLKSFIENTFQRNVVGGCIFVVAKDILSLIYAYHQQRRQRLRTIVNYQD